MVFIFSRFLTHVIFHCFTEYLVTTQGTPASQVTRYARRSWIKFLVRKHCGSVSLECNLPCKDKLHTPSASSELRQQLTKENHFEVVGAVGLSPFTILFIQRQQIHKPSKRLMVV